MRIVGLHAENIKRLKAVDIIPKGDTVLITGRNGQGKTSVLDSIFFALGGKDAQDGTPKPIREGETRAEVTLDLGDMIVKRHWSGHNSYLEVTNKEGAVFKSPQTLLDDLLGRLSFDPLEFSRMKAVEQRAALLDIVDVGIDLDKWEADDKRIRDERRMIGRDVEALKVQVDAIPLSEVQAAPDAEVSVSDVLTEIRAAEEYNRSVEQKRAAATTAIKARDEARAEVERLQGLLERAKTFQATQEAEASRLEQEAATLTLKDTAQLQTKIDTAETTNKIVRRKLERVRLQNEWKAANDKYNEKEKELIANDNKKSEAFKAAKMPIEGLAIDAAGVTFNGQPFSQLSSAEQLKVSLSIAMAKNPKLRVIRILDGSLLDDENLRIVSEMAKDNDFQVWIEKVDTSGKVGIVIEDGMVAADNSAAATVETPAA